MKMFKLSGCAITLCNRRVGTIVFVCTALINLSACHQNSPPEKSKSEKNIPIVGTDKPLVDQDSGKQETGKITLIAEQIERIGLQVATVETIEFADKVAAYGTVMTHDSLAQDVAELRSAQATDKQSRAALTRMRGLSGTPGAVAVEAEEMAVRQVTLDDAALNLAKQRLSATYGHKAPWSDGSHITLLNSLANGNSELVHATFPLGALSEDIPKSLYAAHINAVSAKHWKMTTVWPAPADANVPGRSFFAILNDPDASEGERISVWAPLGPAVQGVLIPQSAVVISDSKYWCYLEEQQGTYVRTEIDIHRPLKDGYFLGTSVKAGDKIVIQGAAQLLAQESNSAENAD